MAQDYQKLPPGWDCKVDSTTGNRYYINYFTKAMQLEDPRMRYKQLQNETCSTESIPLQPMHGSPYHVYPTNSLPAVKAFQGPGPTLQNISVSPLLSTRSQLQMEMSPVIGRQASSPLSRRSTVQETSFSNHFDTEAVVAKIQNMFPTAEGNHIRLLLKKYYNREAVVISALQVEKHPVTMPGPFVTPPAQRHLFHSNSAFQMTPPARRLDIIGRAASSRAASPVPGGRFGSVISMHSAGLYGSPRIGEQVRNSPKPHSSPKMKLRYMKTIFPKADETLLLDILANSDNNVQKASEKLLTMGYQKKDFVAPKQGHRQEEEERLKREAEEKLIIVHPKEYSAEEKEEMKTRLQTKYTCIAERIILMALESVSYSEDRAIQILQIVQEEEESQAKKMADDQNAIGKDSADKEGRKNLDERDSAAGSVPPVTIVKQSPSNASVKDTPDQPSVESPTTSSSQSASPNSILSSIDPSTDTTATTAALGSQKSNKFARSRDKSVSLKNSPKGSTEDESDNLKKCEFQSIIGRIAAMGHNSAICKGPNDRLLLADYVTWNGANPDISTGKRNIAAGPDQTKLKQERSYIPQGRNPENCKGPNAALAKGSIYSSMSKTSNIKCN